MRKERIENWVREDYEFDILYDLHKEVKKEDGQVDWELAKKDCVRKWYVSDLNTITDVRELPTQKGKIYKNKCEVFHRTEQKWVVIKGNYKTILNIIKPENRKTIIGYGIQRRK